MTKKRSVQLPQPPCCKGDIVSMDKVIEVINATDQYSDSDTRTCFWLFAESLKGKKVFDHPDCKRVLRIMKQKRPTAHDTILEEAARILAKMK